MKKLVIISITAAVLSVAFSSCSAGYTCPTYTKMDNQQMVKSEAEARI